jgi:hypothetical protein
MVAPRLDSADHEITQLLVFDNKIYGATADIIAPYTGGSLQEWDNGDAWVEVAPQLNGQSYIDAMCAYDDKIYAGTYDYGATGGHLQEWNGTNAWVKKADTLNSQTRILSLAEFGGKLCAGTSPGGRLFEWDGASAWVQKAGALNSQTSIYSLLSLNGSLYASTGPGGKLFKWDGVSAWGEVAGQQASQTAVYSLVSYKGWIYGVTGPNGYLFRWNGSNAWQVLSSAAGISVRFLIEWDEDLYAGAALLGSNSKFLKWNGVDDWETIIPAIATNLSFASNFVVYDYDTFGVAPDRGRLYAGTQQNASLYVYSDYLNTRQTYNTAPGVQWRTHRRPIIPQSEDFYWTFKLVSERDYATPIAGLTDGDITVEKSTNGGAFSALPPISQLGPIAEIGSGWYRIGMKGAYMTLEQYTMKATASGAAQCDEIFNTYAQ